jgi:hypothetical protein
MVDVITLLRRSDPAARTPPTGEAEAIHARITSEPRPPHAMRQRSWSKRRFTIIVAVAVLALGGTALADHLITAAEVFSSPDAAGQGDLNSPVHPLAGSERLALTLQVAGVGGVELWAATGSTPTGACLGLRFPDRSWGVDGKNRGGNGPACFTERDDPMFAHALVPTGIDTFETDVDTPFTRIVYGTIDSDKPATAVAVVDRVTGTRASVVDGRYFAYVDPRADPRRDDHTLVAYDAGGNIVTAELAEGAPGTTPTGDSNAPPTSP